LPETAARLQLDVARLTQARAAQDLVVDVLNAYWTYSRATNEAEALRASLRRTKDFGDLTLAQIEAGQLAELERDIVSQRVSQAEQALILAEAQVLDAWESLQVSMGKSPGAEPVAPEFGETPRDSFSVESVLERARQSNPELLLLSQELRSAELNLVRSENQTEPQLDAVASLSQRSLSEEVAPSFTQIATLDYTSLFLGLNFVMPLDNTLATAQLEADEIAVERARWRYTEAELQIERQVRQAIRLYETQKKRAELSVDEVRLARKNLEATNLKYAGGLASYLEVMELERTLQDAEIRAAQTELDVKLAHMGVLRLTGELLEQWNVEME
jgi:multidrug efflux system outer membrane protein